MMLVVLATILLGVALGLLCVELADRRRRRRAPVLEGLPAENARPHGNVDVLKPRDREA